MVITLSKEVLDKETIHRYAKSREAVLTNFLKTIKGVLNGEDIAVVDDAVLPFAVVSEKPDGFFSLINDAYFLLLEPKSKNDKLSILFHKGKYLLIYREEYFTLIINAISVPKDIEERLLVVIQVLRKILTATSLKLENIDELIKTVFVG